MGPSSTIDCRVTGASKLPASAGDAESICAAIKRAAAAIPGAKFTVKVQVLGPSSLAATVVTAKGKALPLRKFAVSDRLLNPASIDRFARSLVDAAVAGSR